LKKDLHYLEKERKKKRLGTCSAIKKIYIYEDFVFGHEIG